MACADACLGEEEFAPLVRCIRLNLDCDDVCDVTGRLLSWQTEPNWTVLRAQIEACVAACRACAAACERYAEHHEHCQICAASCRRCEEACTSHRPAGIGGRRLLPLCSSATSERAGGALPRIGSNGGQELDGCDRWRDEVELCALDALGPDEEVQVERHAAVCIACRDELRAARETAACLALAVPLVRAPVSMRDVVLRRARTDRS